ncbi:MAG: hypothetical protein ACE5FO_09050 [Parvularculaceae bacterium]
MSAATAITLYRWVYAVSIFALSLETFLGHPAIHIKALAAVEIAAVVLFVIRPTRAIGLLGLLGVYAWASALHFMAGDIPFRFAIYAGAAALVWLLERKPEIVGERT